MEVVIDPDAHHAEAEAHLVEEAQVITLDGTKHITTISDETSEQVTRWAAALEGYRKEQERLGIPYGKEIHNYVLGRVGRIKLGRDGTRVSYSCFRIFRKNIDFLCFFLLCNTMDKYCHWLWE